MCNFIAVLSTEDYDDVSGNQLVNVVSFDTGLALMMELCHGEAGALPEPADHVEVLALKSLTGFFFSAVLDEDDGWVPVVEVFRRLPALEGREFSGSLGRELLERCGGAGAASFVLNDVAGIIHM